MTRVDYGYIEEDFGYPFLEVHRSALQKSLVVGVESCPDQVTLHLGHNVLDLDIDNTRFKVKNRSDPKEGDGEWIQGDIILAADGIKSKARGAFLKRAKQEDHVVDTGQAAYRILVKKEDVKGDPDLLPLFEEDWSYRWIGEGRHIMAYPICAGTVFNMSTAHPDTHFVGSDEAWTTSGSRSDMLDTFSKFCPRIQKLLNLVPEGEILEWKMRVHDPIDTWTEGNVALIGDACHPTLPHLAQGAAQAIEDACVLGVCLSKVTSKEDIPIALQIYQELRKPRADWAVREASSNGKGLQLGAGKQKEERDRLFAEATKSAGSKKGGANPDKQIDKMTQEILYRHDCRKEAEEKYEGLYEKIKAARGGQVSS